LINLFEFYNVARTCQHQITCRTTAQVQIYRPQSRVLIIFLFLAINPITLIHYVRKNQSESKIN